MKFEFSAGGIVVKCKKKKKYILLAQHSQYHGWIFPKGLIGDTEKGETKEHTALREVKEETGVSGEIIHSLTPETYWYQLGGEKIKKTVYFFVMKYLSGDITEHDFEMEKVEWLPIENVEGRLTFVSEKNVWQEAKEYIEQNI